MSRIATCSFGILLTLLLAAPASAWKNESAGPAMTIAHVQENAERGDFVVVEGEIASVHSGHGNVMIVMLRDATGTVPLRVPNHLLRKFAGGTAKGGAGPTGVKAEVGNRVRVRGDFDAGVVPMRNGHRRAPPNGYFPSRSLLSSPDCQTSQSNSRPFLGIHLRPRRGRIAASPMLRP